VGGGLLPEHSSGARDSHRGGGVAGDGADMEGQRHRTRGGAGVEEGLTALSCPGVVY
jgi:hypothetical protein